MKDVQPFERFVGSWQHFFAGHTLRFQAEADFIEHISTQNLAFGVLQKGADVSGYLRQAHAVHRLPMDEDVAAHFAVIGVRDEPVDAAHQGGFAAARRTSQQHDLTRFEGQVDVLDGRCAARVVLKGQVLDNQWQRHGISHEKQPLPDRPVGCQTCGQHCH